MTEELRLGGTELRAVMSVWLPLELRRIPPVFFRMGLTVPGSGTLELTRSSSVIDSRFGWD